MAEPIYIYRATEQLDSPHIPIIFITAHDAASVRRQATEGGAMNLLHKLFAAAELLETEQMAVRRPNASR